MADLGAPSWRWIFYVNVPVALIALVLAWAASPGWETPRRAGRVDVAGAALFGIALAAGLLGLTLLGAQEVAGTDLPPGTVTAALAGLALVATLLAVVRAIRMPDPFLDVRLFRSLAFSAAALVSLLTGYTFATAIIGGAVFVDRVLYGGPDEQRLALGALAGATAIGALLSGFAVRLAELPGGHARRPRDQRRRAGMMAGWSPETPIVEAATALALFGLGFGLSVTPRSTAAVEAAGRAAFGAASSVVTVARMLGMAIGLAVLTAYGSTTIDRLSSEIYATPEAYLDYIPEQSCAIDRCGIRSSSRRSRRGPPARRRRSWSGCSSWRPSSRWPPCRAALVLGGRAGRSRTATRAVSADDTAEPGLIL